jgi:hypothetical protein
MKCKRSCFGSDTIRNARSSLHHSSLRHKLLILSLDSPGSAPLMLRISKAMSRRHRPTKNSSALLSIYFFTMSSSSGGWYLTHFDEPTMGDRPLAALISFMSSTKAFSHLGYLAPT